MTMILNMGKTEVLPGERGSRDCRPPGRPLGSTLAPIARRNWLREVLGGHLTVPEMFLVLALIFMVGYPILRILEPTMTSISMEGADRSSTFAPGMDTLAAFVAVGLFIYLTVALLWPERSVRVAAHSAPYRTGRALTK